MRRVAITGLGAITPIGNSAAETFASALAARSGVRRAPQLAVGPAMPLVAASSFDPESVRLRQRTAPMDRATAMAVAVARQAIDDASLRPGAPERIGVYWGTGMGAAHSLEESYQRIFESGNWRVKPTMVVTAMNNAAAAQISLEFGVAGPTLTYSVACASSAIAVGEAMRAIRHGVVDRAIAGGSDALLTRGVLCAWTALRTLASEDADDPARSCKPFTADRCGFVLGEGAGALILEEADGARARGVRIYAELAGYGHSSDAAHIAEPSTSGQTRAIEKALQDAAIDPRDVGYVNAHGTATPVGDRIEAASIEQAFGTCARSVPVSSTKAVHGHMMGATGAVELIIATLARRTGELPPTAHYARPDPELSLDFIPNVARRGIPPRAALSNSFAFGGSNAVLAVVDPALRLGRTLA